MEFLWVGHIDMKPILNECCHVVCQGHYVSFFSTLPTTLQIADRPLFTDLSNTDNVGSVHVEY